MTAATHAYKREENPPEPWTAFTELEKFQILRMASVVEMEHLGEPPEDAVFCLLCRGTIALPDVNLLHFKNRA